MGLAPRSFRGEVPEGVPVSVEDPGLNLLTMLRTILELDPERVREVERGFLWWPSAYQIGRAHV